MPDQQAKTPISYCDENERLLGEFTDAVSKLTLIQDQQVAAMVAGDRDFSRFDILIHMATEKKQQAKCTYVAHMDTHGC